MSNESEFILIQKASVLEKRIVELCGIVSNYNINREYENDNVYIGDELIFVLKEATIIMVQLYRIARKLKLGSLDELYDLYLEIKELYNDVYSSAIRNSANKINS